MSGLGVSISLLSSVLHKREGSEVCARPKKHLVDNWYQWLVFFSVCCRGPCGRVEYPVSLSDDFFPPEADLVDNRCFKILLKAQTAKSSRSNTPKRHRHVAALP